MRVVLLGVSVLCLAVPVTMLLSSVTACSSSTTTTSEVVDSGGGSPALPDEGQKTDEQQTPVDTDAGFVDPDATTGDAAPTGTVGTEGDAGTRCQAASLREAESNNDLATANALPGQTLTFCGRLPQGDVDVFKFTMPNVVNDFRFDIESGNIRVQPSLDGQEFSFNSQNYPFKPGGVYALRISSQQANMDYRMKITINQ
jgi:hypothetical protein